MYYVNYHTGVGNRTADTLEEAMELADKGAAFTRCNITIDDEHGNVVAGRQWYAVPYSEDDESSDDPICFGDFGYYDDWYFM